MWLVFSKISLEENFTNGRKGDSFVSDKWITPSVKDCEKQSRNATDISYHIVVAAQKRPTNWVTTLCSSSFKTSLVELFVSA